LGYISSGEIVPEVITTLLNRSKTGLIAMAGSMQLVSHLRTRPRTWREGEGVRIKDIHKVKDGIWNCGVVCFERFEDEEET
jgi:hypothetical protein